MQKIILDFTGCKYFMQVHERLKNAFCFPDYYGNNWSALWDLLQYYTDKPLLVEVKGIHKLPKEWKESIDIMFEVFRDVTECCPNIQFITLS